MRRIADVIVLRLATCNLRLVFLTLVAVLVLWAAGEPVVWARQEMPPPAAAPNSPALPTPVERTLKNGLRVIVVERSAVPLISATVFIRSGGEVDPAELPGLASMTADLLTEGTATRSAPQIAEEVESLGGSIESGARWDISSAGIDVMSTKVDRAMTILADVVRRPAFKDEEIERRRQQALDQLRVSLRQPGTLARLAASRLLFGDAPYGHPLGGTPESIQKMQRRDIVRLHADYYRPDNAILVIGGDIRPASAFRLAQRLFGDWQNGPKRVVPSPPAAVREAPSTAEGPRVLVIDKPDAGQAAVLLTRVGLRRADPDYFAALVANSVLGGGYSARLNQEIRIRRGLSYGAGSSLDIRREPGPFVASTQTKNESAAEVASLLLSQFQGLAGEPIPEPELVARKAALVGGFGRSLETVSGLAAQFASLALYGLNLNEINRYIPAIGAVSADDARRFARARLDSRGAFIVMVGNAAAFLEPLRKQFPRVEVIPEDQLDFGNAGLRRVMGAVGSGR